MLSLLQLLRLLCIFPKLVQNFVMIINYFIRRTSIKINNTHIIKRVDITHYFSDFLHWNFDITLCKLMVHIFYRTNRWSTFNDLFDNAEYIIRLYFWMSLGGAYTAHTMVAHKMRTVIDGMYVLTSRKKFPIITNTLPLIYITYLINHILSA